MATTGWGTDGYSEGPWGQPPFTADTVSFTLSIQDASTGVDAIFLAMDTISYGLSLQSAEFLTDQVLAADKVTFSLSIQDIESTRLVTISPIRETFHVSVKPADLFFVIFTEPDTVTYTTTVNDITTAVSGVWTLVSCDTGNSWEDAC